MRKNNKIIFWCVREGFSKGQMIKLRHEELVRVRVREL